MQKAVFKRALVALAMALSFATAGQGKVEAADVKSKPIEPGSGLLPAPEFTMEGYVCEVVHHPYALDTGYGEEGYLNVYVYSQPNCQGTWVHGRIYSEGVGVASAPEQQWTYSATTFNTLYQNLVNAATHGLKVVMHKATQDTRQIRYIRFRAG